MIPKSTTKLTSGDCCFIPSGDGKHVPFVFVSSVPKKRSYFFGALVRQALTSADVDDIQPEAILGPHAMLHIDCFAKNETPILGNIASRLAAGELDRVKRESLDMSVGAKNAVWGNRTIIKYADEVANTVGGNS